MLLHKTSNTGYLIKKFIFHVTHLHIFQHHYTVRNIEVLAPCNCNDHARECTLQPSLANPTVQTYQCVCQGNTTGTNCEKCLPFYNQFAYETGEGGFVCQGTVIVFWYHSSLIWFSLICDTMFLMKIVPNKALFTFTERMYSYFKYFKPCIVHAEDYLVRIETYFHLRMEFLKYTCEIIYWADVMKSNQLFTVRSVIFIHFGSPLSLYASHRMYHECKRSRSNPESGIIFKNAHGLEVWVSKHPHYKN